MKSWITVTLVLATFFCANLVLAAQDASVTFVTKPSTLIFTLKKDISSTQVATLISTVMGFTVDQKNAYAGSLITNPFNPPRVLVGVKTGVGISGSSNAFSGTEIPLKENLRWDELYTLLVERSERRHNDVKTDYFSFGEENSMQIPVSSVLEKLSKDVIENGSLTPLIYFVDMSQTNLVTPEINDNMKKLEESVSALGGILFLVKSDDISHHHRQVRQAPEQPGTTAAPPSPKEYNLAQDVDENFPIIFNIILFVAISLLIATLAICVAIATMDPGRDSLIYRVTSAQRFKKDN